MEEFIKPYRGARNTIGVEM